MNITVRIELEQGDVEVAVEVPSVVERDDEARDAVIENIAELTRQAIYDTRRAADRTAVVDEEPRP